MPCLFMSCVFAVPICWIFLILWICKWDEYSPEDDKTHLQIQNVPVCGMYSQRKTECNVHQTNNNTEDSCFNYST